MLANNTSLMDLKRESSIKLRLSADWNFEVAQDGQVQLANIDGSIRFPATTSSGLHQQADRLLRIGVTFAELRTALAEAGSVNDVVSFLVVLQQLLERGILEFPLVDGKIEKAVLLPQWKGCVPLLAQRTPAPKFKLHPFACLRRCGETWQLESPVSGIRMQLSSLDLLEDPLVRRALAANGFLEGIAAENSSEQNSALEFWQFHDLFFHMYDRRGWNRDPAGAAFPFCGKVDAPPIERPPWPGDFIDLPADKDESTLSRLLDHRRSFRRYDEDRPITAKELGTLLYRCARIRRTENREAGGNLSCKEVARRPYPSAGASWELEIYPIVDRCDGLDAGAYHYDATGHGLIQISSRTREVDEMFEEARMATGGQARPQVLLAITARFPRVMWTYRSIAYGLILRNTGVLYQTLYLAASELGLAPCAVGSGDSVRFAHLTGLDPFEEGTVGEFMLGGRPYPEP